MSHETQKLIITIVYVAAKQIRTAQETQRIKNISQCKKAQLDSDYLQQHAVC